MSGRWLPSWDELPLLGISAAIIVSLLLPASTVTLAEGDGLGPIQLWFIAAILTTAGAAWRIWRRRERDAGIQPIRADAAVPQAGLSLWVSVIASLAAGAIVILSTWWFGSGANGRHAVNAMWMWLAVGVAVATAAWLHRRTGAAADRIAWVFIAMASSLAAGGCYQELISYPAMIAQYERDPEQALIDAGLVPSGGEAAPSTRMLFEARLYTAAPKGTFALENSLAAVLAGALMLLIAAIDIRGRRGPLVIAAALATLMTICLFWTHSRAAIGATIVGASLLCGLRMLSGYRRSSRAIAGSRLAFTVSGLLIIAAASIGVAAWLSPAAAGQAVRSLAFRGEYWLATLRIIGDHPWGVGPGNFRSYYSRYMSPLASETVADPHSLWFDSLATGGWLLLGLMIVIVSCSLWRGARRWWASHPEDSPDRAEGETQRSMKVWSVSPVGLAVAVIVVAVFCLAANDGWSVLWYAVSGAIFLIALIGSGLGRREIDVEGYLAAATTVLLTLSVSGDAFTPGVSTALIVPLAALLGRSRPQPHGDRQHADSSALGWPIGTAICLGGAWWLLQTTAVGPVRRTAEMLNEAAVMQPTQFVGNDALFAEMTGVDPWEPQLYRWPIQRWLDALSGRRARADAVSLQKLEGWMDRYAAADPVSWQTWWQLGLWHQQLAIVTATAGAGGADERTSPDYWCRRAATAFDAAAEAYPHDVEVLTQAAAGHLIAGDANQAAAAIEHAWAVDTNTPHPDRKLAAGEICLPPLRLSPAAIEASPALRRWSELRRRLTEAAGGDKIDAAAAWVPAEPAAAALRSLVAVP